jgi:hypothetical protein
MEGDVFNLYCTNAHGRDLSNVRPEGAYISMMLLKFPNSAGMCPTRAFLLKLLHE